MRITGYLLHVYDDEFYVRATNDKDRPFLVYNDEDVMKSDPNGRYAIGYIEPIIMG
jgi:hypothetical protein